MGNFIKVNRKILKWEWWPDINTFRLFMYMLLEAWWKDGNYKGKIIPRGSFPSSIAELSKETKLSENEVRTAIKHLKSTGEITSKSHSKYTVFTVKNYDLYQSDNEQNYNQSTGEITSKSQAINEQITNKSRADNKQITGTNIDNINNIHTEKEDKNDKENKNIHNAQKELKQAEANKLFERLWSLYPVKKGKGRVSDTVKLRLLKIGEEELLRAMERYKAELEKDSDWRKPQNGSTFFNSGYVDYLDGNYVPGERERPKSRNSFNNFQQREYDFSKLEKDLLNN